jgi:hypothetical protein
VSGSEKGKEAVFNFNQSKEGRRRRGRRRKLS